MVKAPDLPISRTVWNKHIYMDVVGWSGEIFKCSKVVVEGFALFYLSEQIKGKKRSVSIWISIAIGDVIF